MKTLILIAALGSLQGCFFFPEQSKWSITMREQIAAKEYCMDKAGVYRIEVYSKESVKVKCLEGKRATLRKP